MLTFDVNKQIITRTDSNVAIADSVDYLTATFSFSEEWENCSKTIIFRSGDTIKSLLLENDTCIVPWEVINLGGFKVSVIGVNGNVLITTNVIDIPCGASGYADGEEPEPPTPSEWQQIMAILAHLQGGAINKVLAKKSNADYDFKWVNNEGGGGGGSSVEWEQLLESGTKIATITIDDEPYDVYAPTQPTKTSDLINDSNFSAVSANPTMQGSEADLDSIEINGTKYNIPSGGGSGSLVSVYYDFTNNNASDGQGTVYCFSADPTILGNIDIMWGDSNGIMSNYSPINTIDLTLTYADKVSYAHFNTYNAIPKYSDRILAVKNNVILAQYVFPANKLFSAGNFGNHLYSVGLVSDIHYQYETAADDWETACDYLNDRESVVAICGAGDLTSDGTKAHLDEWKASRDEHATNTPVYTCNGNHESYTNTGYMISHPEDMRQYLDSDYTSEVEPYFYKIINNDVYVFVSIFEGYSASKSNTMFSSACLSWLTNVLETYRNQRVFLFAHVPPYQTFVPTGFWNGNGAYDLDLWGHGSTMKADRTTFLGLLAHYKNVIWFGGHSHIKYNYQETWINLNMARYNTDGAQMVHISSLTVPRDIIDGSVTPYIYAESEGAVMDVYTNMVIIRNRNFADGKFIGLATYMINTTPVIIPPSTPTLTSISATKTVTSYSVGDTLDTSDITVTATYSDSTTDDVTSSATINTSAVDMSTAGVYSIAISYTEDSITETTSISITVGTPPKTLSSISATKTVTTYTVGDTLSTSDITTTATYSDATTATVTGTYDTSNVDMSTAGTYSIGVSYTEDGVTKTTSISITVQSGGGETPVSFTMESGVKIDSTTGAESTDSQSGASDYITAVSGATYTFTTALSATAQDNRPGLKIAFYNGTTASNFLSMSEELLKASPNEIRTATFTIPSGATYFRLRCSLYYKNTDVAITDGTLTYHV